MNKFVKRLFKSKVKSVNEGELEAIVASNSLDRHGEVLDIKGLDLSKYKENPVVAWSHNYDELPIGKATKITKTKDGKLKAKMIFAVNENPKAKVVYDLFKGGFLNAFSIGFMATEMDGNTYTKSEMLEFSAVLVPANSEALVLAKTKGIKIELLEEEKKEEKFLDTSDKKNYNLDKEGQENKKSMKKQEKTEVKKTKVKKSLLKKVQKEYDDKLKALEEKFEAIQTKKINFNVDGADVEKEVKLKSWYKGLVTGQFGEYENLVGKSAMNTTDDSDILPPEEFIAEVSRLEEEFGVASKYANVRRGTAHTLRGITGGDDIEFTETDESGVKPSVKPSYNSYELTYKKYTAIVPVTDELIEDSAINIWNDLTGRFARASAKKQDQIVLSHDASGIINTVGVNTVTIDGTSISDISFDDLSDAVFAVPTPSANNGRFYLHRSVLAVLQQIKDGNDNYIWKPGVDGMKSGTIWGYPYELCEVMPGVTDDAADKGFIIFGDLKNTTLGIRLPMQLQYFDTGIIVDPDDNGDTLNLMTQDIQAVRARLRMNLIHVHKTAYAVIKTGPSAS